MRDEKMIMNWVKHMPHKLPPVTEQSDYVDPEGTHEGTFTRSMTQAEACYYLINCDDDTYAMYQSLWHNHLEARAQELRLLGFRKKLIKANIMLTKQKMKV